MDKLITILNIILPVFIVIATGWFLNRIRFLSVDVTRALNRFVFYIASPLLLFKGAAQAAVSGAFNSNLVMIVCIITIATASLSYILCYRTSPERRGVIVQGIYRGNMVYFGLAVVSNAYGDAGIAAAAAIIMVLTPLYNVIAVIVLTLPHRTSALEFLSAASMIRGIMLNPLIIGSAAGFLAPTIGLPIPVAIDGSITLLARTALPLALIVIGASLDLGALQGDVKMAFIASMLKLVALPAAGYLVLSFLGYEGMALATTTILLASPGAVTSYIMAAEMRGDARLASSIIILTTLLAFITITGWLAYLS